MKSIGLTGSPAVQHLVGVTLAALSTQRQLSSFAILLGVKHRAEAYGIHEEGGELWHCGPHAPDRELIGLVDRVVPGLQECEIGKQAAECLDEFLSKTPITGDIQHG
jgi:hypothetical protein